ncbi:MAG: hypothetical protein VCE43_20665, partial [Myxococcota bacterium]
MKLMVLAATLALLVFGISPAFAGTAPCGDFDADTIDDCEDNCSDAANPAQDDTDGDNCGNICDANYSQSGTVGFPDFGAFTGAFGTATPNIRLLEPVSGIVGFPDFGAF